MRTYLGNELCVLLFLFAELLLQLGDHGLEPLDLRILVGVLPTEQRGSNHQSWTPRPERFVGGGTHAMGEESESEFPSSTDSHSAVLALFAAWIAEYMSTA